MLVKYGSQVLADRVAINFLLRKFSNSLEQIITDPKPIKVFCDFNLHVDLPY